MSILLDTQRRLKKSLYEDCGRVDFNLRDLLFTCYAIIITRSKSASVSLVEV